MDVTPRSSLAQIPEEDEELASVTDEGASKIIMMSTKTHFPHFWNKWRTPPVSPSSTSSSTPISSSNKSSPGHNSDDSVMIGYPIYSSPRRTHVPHTCEPSKNNWILWSMWDSKLVKFPLFQLCQASKDDEVYSIQCTKAKLEELVNKAFEGLRDEQFEELHWGEFEVLRVTQEKVEDGFCQFSESLEIQAHEINFRPVKSEEQAIIVPHSMCLRAYEGLAEILRGIIMQYDILIISGGYRRVVGNNRRYDLNCNKNNCTHIIRVPYGTYKHNIYLTERIIPRDQWKRFQFQYTAEKEQMRRTVKQYKNYVHQEFCRNVRDTFAFTQSSWDLPMPITREMDPIGIYNLLVSPSFKMPHESPNSSLSSPLPQSSSPGRYSGETAETNVVGDDNSSYYTADRSTDSIQQTKKSGFFKEFLSRTPEAQNVQKHRIQFENNERANMIVFRKLPSQIRSKVVTVNDDDSDDTSSTCSNGFQTANVSTASQTQGSFPLGDLHLYGIPYYESTGAKGNKSYDDIRSCRRQSNGHCFCICSYLIWLVAITFLLSLISVIAVLYVASKQIDICPVYPEGDTPLSTEVVVGMPVNPFDDYVSYDLLTGEEEEEEDTNYEFRGVVWIRENWEVAKGWWTSFIQWIDTLDCMASKTWIWIDYLVY